MSFEKVYRAIGLMSGTSLDGVDCALVETNGQDIARPLHGVSVPYGHDLRENLRACLGLRDKDHAGARAVEQEMTRFHAAVVRDFLEKFGISPESIDVIGFHGQTLTHDVAQKFTWQIGDGALLACDTGIDVVNDFRSRDVAAGGQGAPLLPLYHGARARGQGLKNVVILNIGGVSNITWVGENDLIAFDCGPGNALMDDLVFRATGAGFDAGGALAARGRADGERPKRWMEAPFFARIPPKALDRNDWDVLGDVEDLSLEDALATLAEFTVQSVVRAEKHLPEKPDLLLVSGGGRHNRSLMRGLEGGLSGEVRRVDDFGWDGDFVEAEGFAYLAVRSLLGLPISLPKTTGVPAPMTGGTLYKVEQP